ncbi:UNVERIFIED_CONTAM: hypothetical protein FKN15_029161 [Acipenser sinensis]
MLHCTAIMEENLLSSRAQKMAESRLAAKRAARAEARDIRMKELERQQKEMSDDDERMSVGSRGSLRAGSPKDRPKKKKSSKAVCSGSVLTGSSFSNVG